jgi:hypothetical protein
MSICLLAEFLLGWSIFWLLDGLPTVIVSLYVTDGVYTGEGIEFLASTGLGF